MAITHTDKGFRDTTRGRILDQLRRGARTVEELATELELTANAVRAHLTSLERDGYVERAERRRSGGKPAQAYRLTREAETVLSRAYVPFLARLVEVLSERATAAELDSLMREVGARLAEGRQAATTGTVAARVGAAADLLTQLGGVVEIEQTAEGLALVGFGCPLSEAVARNPRLCAAVETVLARVTGLPVQERCRREDRPRCRFLFGAPASAV